MQTEQLPTCDAKWPRLEHFPPSADVPDCSVLRAFPFTIGRVESADLQIDSSRVSREHAVIVKEQDGFRIRDLGSTNGTFLNGEPIEEARLNDGDILTIADTEFTFQCAGDGPTAGMVTQVMTERPGTHPRHRAAHKTTS